MKNLGYKITDTLILHIARPQPFTTGWAGNIVPIYIGLGNLRIVGSADRASGEFTLKGKACLRSELFRGNGQLD